MIGALLHFLTIAGVIGFSAVGVGIGISYIAQGTLQALYIQPSAHKEVTKVSILAMAITETGGVIGLTVALLVLMTNKSIDTTILGAGIGRLGILFVSGISSLVVGYVSGKPAQKALMSVARQPYFTSKIINIMLITVSILQTPIIFGFLVAFLINAQAMTVTTVGHGFALLAAGICLGVGSIGPAVGQSIYAQQACESIGTNTESYRGMLTFSLISQAMIESPIVFALLIALMIITYVNAETTTLRVIAMVVSGLCVAFTNIAPGISSGRVAASTGKQITANLSAYAILLRTSLLVQCLIETFVIYGLIIALILLIFS